MRISGRLVSLIVLRHLERELEFGRIFSLTFFSFLSLCCIDFNLTFPFDLIDGLVLGWSGMENVCLCV